MEPADATDATQRRRLVELLWQPPSAPRRGPRPTLTLTAIARAGIAIADTDGLGAVTMQRVAESLDVTKMALYRYVPGKTELVALMIETGIGEPPVLPADAPWRDQLDAWARQMYDRFRRHPWAVTATVGVRVLGPNELGWMERAINALNGTRLHGGEKLDVVVLLVGHVRNLAQQVAAIPTETPEQAMEPALSALLRGHEQRFPALLAAVASAAAHDGRDQALDFGLSRILDGVQLLLTDRARP
ncbi:transcriptional regulator, TetR family [Micromonospora coriariae]|uniref:Transcriptional regulator, TetR family n=1 Tax=Micromonospora coriariae TaxID=285665 RepID=A0A1C4WWV4_9ACTN|nr:TetR/AcrR family transcriptional regulator [Micromonospora coriariae]SCF00361.1 transcriptional regulator, TetR family [Micromonospora coriariae]